MAKGHKHHYRLLQSYKKTRRKTKRLTTKKRRPFTDEELQRLWAFLEGHNNDYLLMCMLCYCCLIRPKKIALLKCSDFDLKKQTVRVRAEKAKMLKESVEIIDMTSKKTASNIVWALMLLMKKYVPR